MLNFHQPLLLRNGVEIKVHIQACSLQTPSVSCHSERSEESEACGDVFSLLLGSTKLRDHRAIHNAVRNLRRVAAAALRPHASSLVARNLVGFSKPTRFSRLKWGEG